jgi:hypothetical protein
VELFLAEEDFHVNPFERGFTTKARTHEGGHEGSRIRILTC